MEEGGACGGGETGHARADAAAAAVAPARVAASDAAAGEWGGGGARLPAAFAASNHAASGAGGAEGDSSGTEPTREAEERKEGVGDAGAELCGDGDTDEPPLPAPPPLAWATSLRNSGRSAFGASSTAVLLSLSRAVGLALTDRRYC